MNDEAADPDATAVSTLDEILTADFGEPVTSYFKILGEDDRRRLDAELEAVEVAHAAAAARLHTLFAA